ncbi:MAG TPA: TolC family protein, partial [Steroidobacteraceae bacterium]
MTDIGRRRGATFATLIALIALVTLAAVLTGCAVGPNYVKPTTPVAPQFQGTTEGAYSGEDGQGRFWTQFGDATLDRLIDDALAANHDLRIALAHLVEARAERHEAQFDLAPTVTASGGYTKQQFPTVDSPTGAPYTQRFYDAGFDAFWELDFFGRIRRNIEAQSAEVHGAEAGLRDAQVSVTAEVARTYFELRGEQTRFAVTWRNVENQRATLQLTQARFEAGRSTELDTARAQAQLSATLSSIGPLEAAIARSIHRLSVLTGREPAALRDLLAPPRELPELPQ